MRNNGTEKGRSVRKEKKEEQKKVRREREIKGKV
jgi:hypothetical protein